MGEPVSEHIAHFDANQKPSCHWGIAVYAFLSPPLPAAKITFFLSLHSSQFSDLPQEISYLVPWAHHVMLVYLGTAPLAHSQQLGVGFGKSLNVLFHSSCVYMEAVASHLSLIWHCSGWRKWEGSFIFLFIRGTDWALSCMLPQQSSSLR